MAGSRPILLQGRYGPVNTPRWYGCHLDNTPAGSTFDCLLGTWLARAHRCVTPFRSEPSFYQNSYSALDTHIRARHWRPYTKLFRQSTKHRANSWQDWCDFGDCRATCRFDALMHICLHVSILQSGRRVDRTRTFTVKGHFTVKEHFTMKEYKVAAREGVDPVLVPHSNL